jgi:uncharacterized repeat protein (TIGR01451 family)
VRRKLGFLPVAVICVICVIAGGAATASAAPRAFTERFSTNVTGNVTGTANTLLTCRLTESVCATARDGTVTGARLNNNDYDMEYVNTNTADAPVPVFNSSTANLLLPTGATVLHATLYFGGDSTAGSAGAAPPNAAARNTVLFKAPGQSYASLTASQLDFITTDGNDFQGVVDVTGPARAAGTGTYSVANVQAGTGRDRQAGWALAVAYRDTSEPPRNLALFDGFQIVNSGNPNVSIPVSGFRTPPSGPVRTRLGLFGYEGDAGSTGDSVKLNSTTVSDAVNPPSNIFNSSIAADGVHFPLKNPNFRNQLGFDANFIRADGVLPNSATSAVVRLTTGGETYFPGGVAFSTELFAPELQMVKSVQDLDGGQVEPGDTLRYTVTAGNSGSDAATNVGIVDPVPANTTYVPGTLTVDGAPQNDLFPGSDLAGFDAPGNRVLFWVGADAAAQNGGTLAPGASATVTFDVAVAGPPATIPPGTQIANAASADFFAATLGTPLSADSNEVVTTVAAPDLTIVKDPPSFTAVGGTPQSWTLTVANGGTAPTDGSQITVTDAFAGVPPGAFDTVTAASGSGWTCAPATPAATPVTITCTRTAPSALAAGASYPPITITTDVTGAPPLGSVANTTSVAGGGDADTTNNSGTSTGTATTRADLQLLKTATPTTALAGEQVTFTMRVRNGGPSTASGVVLEDTDLAAPDYEVVSAAPSQGACTTAVRCELGSLARDAEATVTIVATVTATIPGPRDNTATLTSDVTDPDASSSTVTVVVAPTADLRITKSASPDPLQSGAGATYTLAVHNDGPQAAADTVVSDPLPAAFTPAAPLPAGCTYTPPPGDRTLSCAVGTVAPGDDVTIAVNGTVEASAGGTILSNSAVVSSATGDPDPTDNQATHTDPVAPAADLQLTKFADSATPTAGGVVTFGLQLVNNGPSAAQDVELTDTLPAGLAFVSASPGCTAGGQTVTCTQASLAAGASVGLQITARLAPGTAGTELTNAAQASTSTPDPIDANDRDVTTVSPVAPPPVQPPPPVIAPPPPPPPVATACRSKRRFTIRLRERRGRRVRSAVVRVRGRRVAVMRRGADGRLVAVIDLRGLPRGTYRVVIRARLRNGRRARWVRSYRTCIEPLPPSNRLGNPRAL